MTVSIFCEATAADQAHSLPHGCVGLTAASYRGLLSLSQLLSTAAVRDHGSRMLSLYCNLFFFFLFSRSITTLSALFFPYPPLQHLPFAVD